MVAFLLQYFPLPLHPCFFAKQHLKPLKQKNTKAPLCSPGDLCGSVDSDSSSFGEEVITGRIAISTQHEAERAWSPGIMRIPAANTEARERERMVTVLPSAVWQMLPGNAQPCGLQNMKGSDLCNFP